MISKKINYDARSLNPAVGDAVEVVIQRGGEVEKLTALYLGVVQLEAYTTPYFRFMAGSEARLINANDVREFRFTVATPDLSMPQIAAETEYTDYDHRRY